MKLRARLIRAGMVHPVADQAASLSTVAFVVPVYDDARGLERVLCAIRRDHVSEQIVVVDDASADAAAIAAVADRYGSDLVRHDHNRGPGAARNTGWQKATSTGDVTSRPEVVVFVDADVVPGTGAARTLLGHFGDPTVAMVAPRVRAEPGVDWLASYEANNSPLDMGAHAALVFPGTRLSYVPSAMLAVRVDVLEGVRGFDEAMRYGEDVDMAWRVIHDGHLVRYEPGAIVTHRNRPSLHGFARQRYSYGSSAASLAARHGHNVSPLQLPATTVATTLALLLGTRAARIAGVAAACASAVPLARKLSGKVDEANDEALRLTAQMNGYALNGLATAATRTWLPIMLLTSRLRRLLAIALVVPSVIDWVRTRPAVDPLTHAAVRAVDHGSYCAGVWSGVLRSRSAAALLPHIRTSSRPDD